MKSYEGWFVARSYAPSDGFIPVYWLPWSANQVYRTVLRPSRKFNEPQRIIEQGVHLTRTAVRENADPDDAERWLTVEMNRLFALENTDPDIFFTAAVNGCSVFIEGTEEQPVVYHANAMDYAADVRLDNAFAYIRKEGYKLRHMIDRFHAFSSAHPKGHRGTGTQTPAPRGTVNKTHYFEPSLDGEYLQYFRAEVETLADRYVRDKRRMNVKIRSVKDVIFEEAIGSVFGKRTNGRWKFYFQKMLLVTDVRDLGTTSRNWQQVSQWHVLDCQQFWPGTSRISFSV